MGAIGGIVGDADRNTLRKMSDSLRHRGKEITVISDEAGVFSRSTQDEFSSGCLNIGNQLITLTGEIYNFEHPLKESIMERITEALTPTSNPGFLGLHNDLDGFYAFGFYDSRKKLLGLARDYVGYCPLYYYVWEDRILFASEIKSILAALDHPVELDYDVLGRFLAYGHCPGLRTLFTGIRRVPPSSMLLFNLKNRSTKLLTYSIFNYNPETRLNERDFCRKIYEVLRDAVIRRTRIGGLPCGVLLSGGVDSSFLTDVLKDVTQDNVIAYTAVFPEEEFNQPNIQIATDSLGIEHNLVLVKHEDVIPTAKKVAYIFDDLVGNLNTLVPGFLLTEKASERVKSIFTADGSDMLFFGAAKFGKGGRTIERLVKIPINIRCSASIVLKKINLLLKMHLPEVDRLKLVVYSRWYKDLLEASLAKEANRSFESILKGFEGRYFDIEEIPLLLGRSSKDLPSSIQDEIQSYFNVQPAEIITEVYHAYWSMIHTNDSGPTYNEKLSGHFGIPYRLPIMTSRKLIQLAARIPCQLKMPMTKESQAKYIWRKTVLLHSSLPSKIVKSEHRGMSANPITQWLLSDLRDEAESLIFDSLGELHIDKEYVANRLRKGNGREVKILLMLSLWYNHYQKMLT